IIKPKVTVRMDTYIVKKRFLNKVTFKKWFSLETVIYIYIYIYITNRWNQILKAFVIFLQQKYINVCISYKYLKN
ncbi:hypothetical protein ACMBCM_09230, partial [Spiroplasma sp. K1]